MESNAEIRSTGEMDSEGTHAGVGIFQSLGLGLLAFTVLMILMGVVLTLFVDLGD